jgi:hypothetical protein
VGKVSHLAFAFSSDFRSVALPNTAAKRASSEANTGKL